MLGPNPDTQFNLEFIDTGTQDHQVSRHEPKQMQHFKALKGCLQMPGPCTNAGVHQHQSDLLQSRSCKKSSKGRQQLQVPEGFTTLPACHQSSCSKAHNDQAHSKLWPMSCAPYLQGVN